MIDWVIGRLRGGPTLTHGHQVLALAAADGAEGAGGAGQNRGAGVARVVTHLRNTQRRGADSRSAVTTLSACLFNCFNRAST